MKQKNLLLLLVPVAAVLLTLVGCSDYDNGFTEPVIKFDKNFKNQFGDIDPEQDWNLAESGKVNVITSTPRDIMIYSENNGVFNILGNFKQVTGTQKLSFDMLEGTQMVVVSDGEATMRAYVGGTVNFDEHTSVASDVLETRSHDVNRNEYEKKGYLVPANITNEELDAVIEAFSIPHYGAINEVTIPWEAIWVQQVYRSGEKYLNGNNVEVTGSDQMNHLQLYNYKAAVNDTLGGHYEHVNDFNTAYHHSSWQDIIGLTLMYNIDPSEVVTEEIRDVYGKKRNWVKQWAYHNTQDSQYHYDYIYKMVGDNLYIGFDFYAHHADGLESNKNMDVERDWVFNDWILKVAPAVGMDMTQPIPQASPLAWVLACEDLGSTDDIDYNDVVVKVEHVAGEEDAYITPLAAGGTLASYLYFTSSTHPTKPTCVGEIHQLFNTSYKSVSGSYPTINVGSEKAASPRSYPVTVGANWSIACYSTTEWNADEQRAQNAATNMGGFSIKVLPKGTEATGFSLDYNSTLYDGSEASVVQSPERGETPYILCIPFAYYKMNGRTRTAYPWAWPGERMYINNAYSGFTGWVEDHNENKDWFTSPNSNYVVNASTIPTLSSVVNSNNNANTSEVDEETLATIDSYYQMVGVTEWVRNEIPEPILKLKEGIDEIRLTVGETIDLYDYVETNFPFYCDIQSTGDVEYANSDRTSIRGAGDGGKTITVKVKQYAINGKELDVTVKTVGSANFWAGYWDGSTNSTVEVDGKTIEIKAGQTFTFNTSWNKTGGSIECTTNNDNISASINGKDITVTAGNTVGATATLTVNFTPDDNLYQSATVTINFTTTENQQDDQGGQQGEQEEQQGEQGEQDGTQDSDYGTTMISKIGNDVFLIQDVLDIADGSEYVTAYLKDDTWHPGTTFRPYNNGTAWGETPCDVRGRDEGAWSIINVPVSYFTDWKEKGYTYFQNMAPCSSFSISKGANAAKRR